MASFDFITEPEFRASLEADSRDMATAIDSKSWKVVHVLAGSIIEAVLADYLLTIASEDQTGNDPLEFTLGQLISASREKDAISETTVQLSTVIRDYRNLIHPGRALRLSESPDENTAQVARSLVEIIVQEIDKSRSQSLGLTAEQLVSKVEDDRSSLPILNHLLAATHAHEIERLLLEVLPTRYFQLYASGDTALESLALCFREAFKRSSSDTRTRVCQRYIDVLRREDELTVLIYETDFFRCTDLRYLTHDAVELAKAHILSRLQQTTPSPDLLTALEGLPGYLSITEVEEFVDPLIRLYISTRPRDHRELARSRLHEATGLAPPGEIKSAVLKRLDEWTNHYREKEASETLGILEELMADLDLPF